MNRKLGKRTAQATTPHLHVEASCFSCTLEGLCH
jgi:hypothetical protein